MIAGEVFLLQYWMISIMNHYGYLGIALLILIENLFPPIPSEVILTFGGFLTTYTNMNLIGVILFSTLGSVLGAVCAFIRFGSLVPVFKLEAIVEGRLGKLLHFKKEDVSHAVEWFDSKGNYTVFFCRFIPIVRSLISIPDRYGAHAFFQIFYSHHLRKSHLEYRTRHTWSICRCFLAKDGSIFSLL